MCMFICGSVYVCVQVCEFMCVSVPISGVSSYMLFTLFYGTGSPIGRELTSWDVASGGI